jgi:hypothetical protein
MDHVPEYCDLVVDLPEHHLSYDPTLPYRNIDLHQKFKPDMMIFNNQTNHIIIVELTVPSTSNMEIRHREKTEKYTNLIRNLPTGMTGSVIAFEVSCEGGQSSKYLGELFSLLKIGNRKAKEYRKAIRNTAIRSSAAIMSARDIKFWTPA